MTPEEWIGNEGKTMVWDFLTRITILADFKKMTTRNPDKLWYIRMEGSKASVLLGEKTWNKE